ncbi:hypothetical protein [Acetivibrio straminisolvens]|jgi:hypothetical protein|uniref:Uncharacterized protein n=1 Tax=Acetivibrio straminisolvens JCM 21531 TaxID=1294263 RepID=W4VBK4_9FIRM|nr:hypothetical protein [Acetivibrio straminisolvens]GAE90795.1 hypothetical protein JCM21531_4434 [Acetivibrio straminisolvens JCM 21531]
MPKINDTMYTLYDFDLPHQYKNPLSQFASYPTAIKKRVYELPQYKDFIALVEHKNWKRKILSALLSAAVLATVAYFSGKTALKRHFFMYWC